MPNLAYDLNHARFAWSHTSGSVAATALRFKVGTSPGVYTLFRDVTPAATGEIPVNSIVTSPGTYYVRLAETNTFGEGRQSSEVGPFDLGAVPNGSVLSLSILA